MSREEKKYDWVAAALSLCSCESSDIRELVSASGLDPAADEVATIDLSDIDLSDQDLSGWNLKYANFKGAKLKNAKLRNCILDTYSLIEAVDWREARLDLDVRLAAELSEKFMTPVENLELSVRTMRGLLDSGVERVGDIIAAGEAGILRLPNLGRKSLNELREVLALMKLDFKQTAVGWPPKNILRSQLSIDAASQRGFEQAAKNYSKEGSDYIGYIPTLKGYYPTLKNDLKAYNLTASEVARSASLSPASVRRMVLARQASMVSSIAAVVNTLVKGYGMHKRFEEAFVPVSDMAFGKLLLRRKNT